MSVPDVPAETKGIAFEEETQYDKKMKRTDKKRKRFIPYVFLAAAGSREVTLFQALEGTGGGMYLSTSALKP